MCGQPNLTIANFCNSPIIQGREEKANELFNALFTPTDASTGPIKEGSFAAMILTNLDHRDYLLFTILALLGVSFIIQIYIIYKLNEAAKWRPLLLGKLDYLFDKLWGDVICKLLPRPPNIRHSLPPPPAEISEVVEI
jgi:hypothetical protein